VLLWRLVAPGILFLLAALLALAWRHLPSFGPPLPLPSPLRRSLAEQIRANARFAWRTRSLGGLRTSARISLDEAAARHIAGYGSLDASQRAERLAELTGLDPTAIRAARDEGAARRLNEERAAITLMEVCRRILLRMHSDHQRRIA
jgi:S-adenosylmethionine:diacylglycerol 3-amino-3-carboxypropyl transferase